MAEYLRTSVAGCRLSGTIRSLAPRLETQRIGVFVWTVQSIAIPIKRLRIFYRCRSRQRIDARKSSVRARKISCLRVIKAAFRVPFVAGKLLPDPVVPGVALRGRPTAHSRKHLLAERHVIVAGDYLPELIGHDPRASKTVGCQIASRLWPALDNRRVFDGKFLKSIDETTISDGRGTNRFYSEGLVLKT